MRDTERKVGEEEAGLKKINIEIPRGGSGGGEIRSWKTSVFRSEIEKVRGERGSNFLQTPPRPRKKGFTYRGNSSSKVTTDAEESGNGSPCYRHPFETSDTSDKRRGVEANSPRKGGKVRGKGKSKGTGMRASFALLHLTSTSPFAHWVNTVLSIVRSFSNSSLRHPFFLSFFLSVPSRLCDPRSSSFDSIPFPAILRIRFFPSVHRPLSTSVCTELALYRNLAFLDRIVQFFRFYSFFFFFTEVNTQIFSSFGESRSLSCT